MRRHLKVWFETRKSRRQKEKVAPTPQMPCLTSPRPRVLTPSSSEQNLSLPLQSSPLFSKLPTEIRRQILVFAFGDRTVHMDLVLEHPTKPGANSSGQDYRHGNLSTRYGQTLDRSQPHIWKWKGCVCHRVVTPQYRKILQSDEWVPQPADDHCCSGEADFCRMWTEHYGTNDACFIGVMGWLLACRQSYAEGVDVLYHTNTIHMSSKDLISNLPNLILPQRLSMMTSLEVVWLIDSEIRSRVSVPQHSDLNQILSILDTHFPKLQRLNLALKLKLYDILPVEMEEMVKTLDLFVARRGQYLQEPITVSLASWAFEQLVREVYRMAMEERGLDSFKSQSWLRHKVWHYLDGSELGRWA
ncbi:hypothetical protein FPOAC1_011543 [Fusarium poae]|uniref:hypothetical protein n=1 Tax=Fusarium poae TaxID=36050 RepID=UPI001CE88989|nr:hypothetical protein FPOAC1_011543 [Fusarium poae]KAG8666728.1 hypothetical protein FPOAC1_011543 [Fusarium poae]